MNDYTAHRPVLRDDCSLQMQRTWQEGSWANVINMAKAKAKATKDHYFEALELAARSQLDSPIDRQAAWQAVEKLIIDKVAVKDAATVDLYEWALVSNGMDSAQYHKYIGVMRVSVVKANPKNKDIAKTSFFSCIANEDWNHAQEISTIMDQSFPAERQFHFRHIVSTYLYSTSIDSDDVKKSVMRAIALRKIELAKASRIQNSTSGALPARAITTQDEMLLWLAITVNETKEDADLVKCLTDPQYNALSALKDGFETICSRMMDTLRKLGAWDELYSISRAIVENGIAFLHLEYPDDEEGKEAALKHLKIESTEDLKKDSRLTAESMATRTVVKDWKMWENFILAASKQPDAMKALEKADASFVTITYIGPKHAIYRTQLDMARLIIVFETPTLSKRDASQASEIRIDAIMAYINSHYRDISCVDNLKRFLLLLSISDAKLLLERLGTDDSQSEESQFQNTMLLTLRLRLRYLFTTSSKCYTPSSTYRGATCGICGSDAVPERCETCLKDISKACVWAWKTGFKNEALLKQIESEGVSPSADLVIIGSVCLLKLAGVDGLWGRNDCSPLVFADCKRVMQAILWMDAQHRLQPFKRQDLSVLLVKMYILIGAASHAKTIWDSLEVKNVTLNCLGPLFTDRLGTMAPGLWVSSGRTGTPTSPYLHYYRSAINKNIPTSLRLAFDSGNYASVLGNLFAKERTKQSCTLVMALVDHYRGIRSVDGEVSQEAWQDSLAQHIKPGMYLFDTTDYGPFPSIEANPDRPIQDFLGIGPGLSMERAHLSLLSERFLSLVSYKEPKDYKPTNVALAKDRDRNVVIPTCQDLTTHMSELMSADTIRDKLTLPEVEYYSLVLGLASYISLSLTEPKDGARDRIVELIRSELVCQTTRLKDRRIPAHEADTSRLDVYHDLAALHANGMLRESALVTVYVIRYLERTRNPDAKSPMPQWMNGHIKTMKTASTAANTCLKEYIQRLNSTVTTAGWVDRISEWAFGDLVNGTRAVSDDAGETFENSNTEMLLYKAIGRGPGLKDTTGQIVKSWQEAARGWSKVKIVD
ncbi:N-acetyltransferase B complex non catalytic subunit [Apiospora arundinis]|uniref:N-acetyltransferase B complex non catalytic subunit-domain-containing protein n=1 Tax=Apiospora arundinis TaxID=335852 RepID=A0ABR2J6G6_9PEZI